VYSTNNFDFFKPKRGTMMIELGSTVKDKSSEFEGKVTARAEYLNGAPRIQVTAPGLHEGKPVAEWFDETAVDVASPPSA
jgi:hypothetical protein